MTMQRGDLKVDIEDDGTVMVGRPYEGLVLDVEEAAWLMHTALPAAIVRARSIEKANG